jgi:hypothetical protein
MINPMRATIIPIDTFCSVDGVGFDSVDMSSIPANLHAMQWYGTWGEEEYRNPVTREMGANVRITSLDRYEAVFDSYWQIRNAAGAAQAEEIAEQTIIEV